jgi:hypothetical protein
VSAVEEDHITAVVVADYAMFIIGHRRVEVRTTQLLLPYL